MSITYIDLQWRIYGGEGGPGVLDPPQNQKYYSNLLITIFSKINIPI